MLKTHSLGAGGCTMAQAVSRCLSPQKTVIQFGVSPLGFVVDKVALWQVFLPVLRLSSVTVIPPIPHAHLHLNFVFNRRTNWRRPGNGKIKNIIAFSEGRENGKHCIKKYFHFCRSRILWRTAEWWLLHCSNEWQNWMTELAMGDRQMTTQGRRQKIMLNPNHGQRERKEDYWRAWLFQDLSSLGAKNAGSCNTNARRVIVTDFLRCTKVGASFRKWSRFMKLDSTFWTRIRAAVYGMTPYDVPKDNER